MQKVTISELKNRLSAYLRHVRAGDTVLVYDRNRPVARIERIGGREDGDERIARLEAAGLARRPTASLPLKFLTADPPRATRSAVATLIAERAEGR